MKSDHNLTGRYRKPREASQTHKWEEPARKKECAITIQVMKCGFSKEDSKGSPSIDVVTLVLISMTMLHEDRHDDDVDDDVYNDDEDDDVDDDDNDDDDTNDGNENKSTQISEQRRERVRNQTQATLMESEGSKHCAKPLPLQLKNKKPH